MPGWDCDIGLEQQTTVGRLQFDPVSVPPGSHPDRFPHMVTFQELDLKNFKSILRFGYKYVVYPNSFLPSCLQALIQAVVRCGDSQPNPEVGTPFTL